MILVLKVPREVKVHMVKLEPLDLLEKRVKLVHLALLATQEDQVIRVIRDNKEVMVSLEPKERG